MTGAAAGDQFGAAVGTAGDVNGDGYDDVVVGAPYNDAGGTDAGRAYVFYGGREPQQRRGPDADRARGGRPFRPRGGNRRRRERRRLRRRPRRRARTTTRPGPDAGAAYVFHGGASPDAVADATLTARGRGRRRSASRWATAGDVNGDGHADVVVGAYGNDTAAGNAGRAYVCYLDPPQAA